MTAPLPIDTSQVLVVREVAALLKVSPWTIHRLLKQRALPAFRIGGKWRFLRSELERWMREGEQKP